MKALGLLVTMLCVAWSVHAQLVEQRPAFRVTYGILLDGKEPKAGTAYCSVDKTCTLIDDADVQLDLKLSTGLNGGAELSVICRPFDCSFSDRMPTVAVRDHSTLYLIEGSDVGVLHDLVARMNRDVGSVRLDIRKAP